MFTSANSKILHPLFVVCQCGYGAKPRGPTSARSLTRYTVPGTVNVPAGTQACPPGKGTLTGTIRAADIVGAPVQGIQSGDLAAAAEVLGSGQSYAQIHTKLFTPGEVRGQIEVEDERENES
jgi:hypothetical protein